jgi:hypothetical protein
LHPNVLGIVRPLGPVVLDRPPLMGVEVVNADYNSPSVRIISPHGLGRRGNAAPRGKEVWRKGPAPLKREVPVGPFLQPLSYDLVLAFAD